MVKYAYNSYIIVPSSKVESRQGEVKHAERWAVNNNLKVNVAKYLKVVFYDKRSRKSGKITLPPLPGIKRDITVEIQVAIVTKGQRRGPLRRLALPGAQQRGLLGMGHISQQ